MLLFWDLKQLLNTLSMWLRLQINGMYNLVTWFRCRRSFQAYSLPQTFWWAPLSNKHVYNSVSSVLSNFITWKILQDCIPAMEKKFSRIEQKFKNSIQRGHVEQIKRWQRCVKILSESFHQVLNFLYVEQKFSEDSRRKVSLLNFATKARKL